MTRRLQTETDTPEMEKRVRHAARRALGIGLAYLQTDFEHGQWWVTDRLHGGQWSVVDAEGSQAVDGFGFERVTDGDE